MEVWDAYRADGSNAKCELLRGKPIPSGLYHLVSEILVMHTDGTYLLMQRDFNKEGYPGMFEATAGGSALKGETPVSAALRELKEETGINAKELTQINKTHNHNTIFYSFLCITDCDKSSVKLQEGETISYRWVSKDEFIRFINNSESIPPQRERLLPYLKSIIDRIHNRRSNEMIVPVTTENEKAWADLCVALWPDESIKNMLQQRAEGELPNEFLYIIDTDGDKAAAFLSLSLRNDYVEGTDSTPVGYIEGIYVRPEYREKGIAKELVEFAKQWSIKNGCSEMASDCELGNGISETFHKKMGFKEVNRIICFTMDLHQKK